jgi:hypothetical protein
LSTTYAENQVLKADVSNPSVSASNAVARLASMRADDASASRIRDSVLHLAEA